MEIDATGLVVAPGFINVHSHSDMALFANQRATNLVVQGITTELVGNCGWSLAPTTPEVVEQVLKRRIFPP